MKGSMSRVRLNLELEPKMLGSLHSLKEKTEAASVTEVIRKALTVYGELVNLKYSGWNIIMRKKGEQDKTIVWL